MSGGKGEQRPGDADLGRLADSARRAITAVRTTRAPDAAIDEACAALDRAAQILAPHAHAGPLAQNDLEGGVGLYGRTDDPMVLFPYSPVIGRRNPISPPVELWLEDGVVHGRAVFGAAYCGPPNHVHGGVVAQVLDELLGTVNVMHTVGAMTGTLTIRYRAPTPLFEEIRLEGHQAGVDGRKVYAEGSMWHGDTLLAEAHGIFILVEGETRERLGIADGPEG